MNLVSETCCRYCSIFRVLPHVFARLLSRFLQNCETDMKYFVVTDIYFFICNVLGGTLVTVSCHK